MGGLGAFLGSERTGAGVREQVGGVDLVAMVQARP